MTMTMTIIYFLFNIIIKVIDIESWIIIQINMVMLGDYYMKRILPLTECSHHLAIGGIRLIYW